MKATGQYVEIKHMAIQHHSEVARRRGLRHNIGLTHIISLTTRGAWGHPGEGGRGQGERTSATATN